MHLTAPVSPSPPRALTVLFDMVSIEGRDAYPGGDLFAIKAAQFQSQGVRRASLLYHALL